MACPKTLGLSILLFLSLYSTPGQADPWEDLFGPGKAQIWTEPSARFYLDLPVGWKAVPRPLQSNFVDLWRQSIDTGAVAHLTVEMRNLPSGIKLVHFAARVEEEAQRATYHYQLHQKDRVDISGAVGQRTYFTYQVRDNAELTREAVQVVFLAHERGFIITLEYNFGQRGIFWKDYERMIKSFVGHGVGEEAPGPKKQRPIRSGELINPEAIPY